MTAKEAIMQIQAIPEKIWNQLSEPDNEAINMAISALQEQDSPKPIAESVQNVQNEDLISRKAAIDAVSQALKRTFVEYEDIARTIIGKLPSAQPEIIHCRECQHHRRDNTGCYYCVRKEYGYGWGLNDFCSDAERRTDEQTV